MFWTGFLVFSASPWEHLYNVFVQETVSVEYRKWEMKQEKKKPEEEN